MKKKMRKEIEGMENEYKTGTRRLKKNTERKEGRRWVEKYGKRMGKYRKRENASP